MRKNASIRVGLVAMVAAMAALVAPAAGAATRQSGPDGRVDAAARAGGLPPRWETSSAGRLPDTGYLGSVSAPDRDHAWAVGHRNDRMGTPHGVIMRWDGEDWRPDDTPGLPEVRYWHTVSAVSPHEVWAYGWGDTGDSEIVVRFDGKRWRPVALPELPGGGIYGFAELSAAPGRTWLAGDGRISAYDRGGWHRTELARGVTVADVDARSARDAWAVGGFALVGQRSRPVALHWNGRRWQEVRLPFDSMRLSKVYAESAHSVWVSGYALGQEDYPPKVLHWNGKRWRDVTGPVKDISPQALSGDGRGRIWLSGDPAGWEGPAVYWRYDGRRWTRVQGPTVPGGRTQSYQITDLAPIGRTGRTWAVGAYELLGDEHTSYGHELIQRSTR
ncbi:hypothetical protein ACZ90_27520 [Streptomyces albus subsp. albus]|nr:hypothetical protein ACZ90_27520 [Streptomyces albus subsp. albus]